MWQRDGTAAQAFTQHEVEELLRQILLERQYDARSSVPAFASAIMGATDGLKGLTGAILHQVRMQTCLLHQREEPGSSQPHCTPAIA